MKAKTNPQRDNDALVLAGHEAGHTVFTWYHPELPGVDSVTLREDSDSLGHTLFVRSRRQFDTERYFRAEIASDLAGRVAERLLFGEMSDLGNIDLERATDKCGVMVREHGLGKRIGSLHLKKEPVRPPLLMLYQQDVHDIALECTALATVLLRERYKRLVLVTRTLVRERTLKQPRIEELLGPRPKRRLRTIGRFPRE